MISFPRKLHESHRFSVNGQPYIADLATGEVIALDEITCAILDLCSHLSSEQIINELAQRYSAAEIHAGLAYLAKVAHMRLLFSEFHGEGQIREEGPPPSDSAKLKILVTSSFVDPSIGTSFLLNSANYNLLRALTVHTHLHLAYPEMRQDLDELEAKLRIEGVTPVVVPLHHQTYSPVKFIPQGCDGVLSLAAASWSEQAYLRCTATPVLFRLCSEMLRSQERINRSLAHITALRDCNAIVCDAPWIRTFFSQVLPEVESDRFHYVPYGVDTAIFHPMEKETCKHQLAQALGDEEIVKRPLVGVVPGMDHWNSQATLTKLQAARPDLHWLVLQSNLDHQSSADSDSVSFFSVTDLQDMQACPFILNALDLLVFPSILGAPSPLLFQAAACGVPLIVWGYSPLDDRCQTCRFIHVEPALFEYELCPSDLLLHEISLLIENQGERERLGHQALEFVSSYTWDRSAKQMIHHFRSLQTRMASRQQPTHRPLIFAKYYHRVQDQLESYALDPLTGAAREITRAVAIRLLETHTVMEVRAVLMQICQNQESATQILEEIDYENGA